MTYFNRDQAVSALADIDSKLYRAHEYLAALKTHTPARFSKTRYDKIIEQCIEGTQFGISRLLSEKQEIQNAIADLSTINESRTISSESKTISSWITQKQ